MATLADNDKTILLTVVEAYVRDCIPVSSQRVKNYGGYSVSTATIRNRLASLEEKGYLVKTHVSSGRIPTDIGYRIYVDDLRSRRAGPSRPEIATRCRSELREFDRDVSEILLRASQFLGSVSRNFAVVYGAIESESCVRNVKIVRLDEQRLLVVVNLEPDHERTMVLRVDREFTDEVVSASERLMNQVVSGKTMIETRNALMNLVRDNMTDEGIIVGQITAQRDAIFNDPPAVELCFEERNHVLDQPELSDPKILQMILKLLHNKPYLTSVLSSRSSDRTEVTIGGENADAALSPFSLVTSGYRMGAARGVLGIIGPTRMRYDLALSLVTTVASEMRAIGEELF